MCGKKPCNCLICPNCGAHEVRERTESGRTKTINIRAYKVANWSQCLVCAGYYDEQPRKAGYVDDGKGNILMVTNGDPVDESYKNKGWF